MNFNICSGFQDCNVANLLLSFVKHFHQKFIAGRKRFYVNFQIQMNPLNPPIRGPCEINGFQKLTLTIVRFYRTHEIHLNDTTALKIHDSCHGHVAEQTIQYFNSSASMVPEQLGNSSPDSSALIRANLKCIPYLQIF